MRPLNEIRQYMDNYHVKSGVYHYYRNEFSQALGFLRKALADVSTLSRGERQSAQRYLTLSLKGLGQKLAADGDVENGVEHMRLATVGGSDYPDLHFEMGCMLQQVGRPDEAIESYRRAIECQPSYLEAQVALGGCLLDAGRDEEATAALRHAMELKLDKVRRPFDLGLGALGRGETDAAREWFHEALRAEPQLSKEYMREAVDWIRTEEFERAVASLDRALGISPKYPDLHNYRGIALFELLRHDEAVAAFRRSAELCPDHLVARLNLAFALLAAGQVDEGEVVLESILEGDPAEPVARAKLDELRSARTADRRGQGVRS